MENLNIDKLSKIVGGRYRLVALIQKRLRELYVGKPPLIEDYEGLKAYEIVAAEIEQEKIWLVMGEEADKLRKLRQGKPAPQIEVPTEKKRPSS